MKLEVGMYVRTKHDGIQKIKRIKEEKRYNEDFSMGKTYSYESKNTYIYYRNDDMSITCDDVLKASHDILELLEPLDLMYIDIDPDDGNGGIVVPRIAETLNELKKWKERISSGECKLVSITTHEEIEQGSYKVGE